MLVSHVDNTITTWKINSSEGEPLLVLTNTTAFNFFIQRFIQPPKGKHFAILCGMNNLHLCHILQDNLEHTITISGERRKNFCLSTDAKLIAFNSENRLIIIKRSARCSQRQLDDSNKQNSDSTEIDSTEETYVNG